MTTGPDSGDLNLEGSASSGAAEPGQESPFDLKLELMGVDETATRAPESTPVAAPAPASAPASASTPTPTPTAKATPVRSAKPAQAAGQSSASGAQELNVATVNGVFIALDKAIRARRLYQPNNPVYLGFVNTLKELLLNIWDLSLIHI